MTDLDGDYEHPVGETLRRYFEQQVTPEVRARHTMAIYSEAHKIRLAERRAVRVARRPRRAVVASLVGAMLVGSSTGALAASDDSLPGDILYPVKRSSEQARLFAAAPFSAVGTVHLDIAKARVEEAAALATARPTEVPHLVEEAKLAIEAAQAEGVDVAALAPDLQQAADSALALAEEADPDAVIGLLPPPTPGAAAGPSVSPSPLPSDTALASPAPSPGASVAATPGAETGVVGVATPTPGAPETSTVTVPQPTPSPAPSPTAQP